MGIENNLWVEKYRPNTLDGYVFTDPNQKSQIEKWVREQEIPQVLLYGGAGTGKTSLALILVNLLGIHPHDFMQINASRENNVDMMRNKITNFVETMPFGKMKVILLDESDGLSPAAQAAFRGIMETYSSTSRFILTANYPHKIIPAIHSRCQSLHINKLDLTEFTARIAEILVTEQINFDLDVLDNYVKGTYPDMRKCINECQQHSVDGELQAPLSTSSSTGDYRVACVELVKGGNIRAARQLVCNQARPEEMDEIYRWMYDNLDLWGGTDEQKDMAIVIIAEAVAADTLVADREINLAACFCKLAANLR